MVALALAVMAPERASAALSEGVPVHASGDREVWNRKANQVELFGHAIVRQPGEYLSADHIFLDNNARTLDAYGNCVYIASDTIIYGEEMHFNLDTRTGTIIGGRVANDRFSLGGERIHKLGPGRFQTHWGEYTTCRDCAKSWTFEAQDVDLELEGYAYMKNVAMRVKDTPAFWFPYMIVPMKTRRQSGLLFPSFGIGGQSGFRVVQPFYWAISRSTDMTFGVGTHTKRGFRGEWEGRYALSPRSTGTARMFYLYDSTFGDGSPNSVVVNPSQRKSRWAVDTAATHELFAGLEAKLRIVEMSDNYYPTYVGDVPGAGELTASSVASLTYSSPSLSAYVAGRRIRNLLPDPAAMSKSLGVREFDGNTVQALPTAVVTSNDQFLFGLGGPPVAAGLTLGASSFSRPAGPWDPDVLGDGLGGNRPGVNPLREATRMSINPSIYSVIRPWDLVSITPSARYYGYYYFFRNEVDNWYRSYVQFQVDLTTQLERVFPTSDPAKPRRKHLIRPLLSYSIIPQSFIHADPHPFQTQIQRASAAGRTGYQFDNLDIVPLDASPEATQYFTPLGNSLTYGFTTQLIERQGIDGDPDASYRRLIELSAGQSVNFREYQNFRVDNPARARDPQPLTRFFGSLLTTTSDGRYSWNSNYYYYPYIQGIRHQLTTEAQMVIERGAHQRILSFDRSLLVRYSWNRVGCVDHRLPDGRPCGSTSDLETVINYSLSDYILPSASTSFDFLTNRWLGAGVNLVFQSPSQCWKFSVGMTYTRGQLLNWGFDLSLNLTGSGFGGASEALNQVAATAK